MEHAKHGLRHDRAVGPVGPHKRGRAGLAPARRPVGRIVENNRRRRCGDEDRRAAKPGEIATAMRRPTVRTAATSYASGRKGAACSSAGIGNARYGSVVARDRLVRPRNGRVIAGVCAAIADRFGISRTAVRIAFVLSIVLPGPQVVVYLLLWILIPSER